MTTSNPFAITISFPSGSSDGVQIVEKTGWSGKGVVFPKPLLKEAETYLSTPGVYVLWERGEERPRAYIGQSGSMARRLGDHNRDPGKEFWTWAAVFEGGLNAAHIQYLEARLVELAKEANRCERGDDTTPRKRPLGLNDEILAETFLDAMLLCLRIVGVDFFEKTTTPDRLGDQSPTSYAQSELTLTGANQVDARGFFGSEFVVKAGSKVSKVETSAVPPPVVAQRKLLLDAGVLVDKGEHLEFIQDYAFNSPSRAAGVCLGRASNGWNEWRDSEGRSLHELG